jgi:hypothetical protein
LLVGDQVLSASVSFVAELQITTSIMFVVLQPALAQQVRNVLWQTHVKFQHLQLVCVGAGYNFLWLATAAYRQLGCVMECQQMLPVLRLI